jgi:hypothetical protein
MGKTNIISTLIDADLGNKIMLSIHPLFCPKIFHYLEKNRNKPDVKKFGII